jgi:hypothetical protein
MFNNRSVLALATAALFIVTGILELAHDQVSPFAGTFDYVIEAAFLAALAAGAAACWELRRHGAKIAWTIAAAGHGILLLPVGATFLRGEEALDALFGVGFLALTLGFLTAAVFDVRRRVTPRYAGLALLVAWIATVALDSTIGVCAGWLAVAALAIYRAELRPSHSW